DRGSCRRRVLAKNLSQLSCSHPGVVYRCVRLEILPARESADDDRVEADIADKSGCDFKSILIIAGQRDADAVSVTMCLSLKGFEIHCVERLHPSCTWKYRGGPPGRALWMPHRLACCLAIPVLVGIPGVK